MLQLGIAFLVALLTAFFVFSFEKERLHVVKTLKWLSVLLFFVFLFRLYTNDVIDATFNLFAIDVDYIEPRRASDTWVFGVTKSTFMIFLRWATMALLTWAIVGTFFKHKLIRYLLATLGVLVAILNIIFLRSHFIAFEGLDYDLGSYRSVQYMLETVIFSIIMLINLYIIFKEAVIPKAKEFGTAMLVFVVSALAVTPLSLFYNFAGNYGEVPDEFVESHIFVIVFPFILMIAIYVGMRKKAQIDKDMMLVYLVFAAFFQYFYYPRWGLNALPLHLCNTAIILMLIAFVFKKEGFFYFTYFANVIGAIVAIMTPNYSRDFFDIRVMHFGYNHLYAFIIPILAVALKTFPRPTLKHMSKAIGIFAIYFVTVVFVNAWFVNYGSNPDYFFTNSDHITDILTTDYLNLVRVQYNHIWSFEMFGLSFEIFYLYVILFFFGFIFLMFMNWYLYDSLYQMFDRHYELKEKHKRIRMERRALIKRLAGRKPSEPINPEGKDIISIRNFSKRYGSSKLYAVKDFSLTVEKGDVFGFLGHNGAGKSTTIKSLVGIQSITEGEMEVCGYSIKSQAMQAKRLMGYVSDNHAVYERLTGREYVNYIADLYNVSEEKRNERLNDYVERFGLAHAIDQEVKSYSHGMKQKLVVIASLVHDPKVWVLDEPLTGLDPTSAFQIKEAMRQHALKGNIVFFSSHVIEVVERICNKIAIINQGKLIGVYPMEKLKEKNIALEDLYISNNITI